MPKRGGDNIIYFFLEIERDLGPEDIFCLDLCKVRGRIVVIDLFPAFVKNTPEAISSAVR